MGPSEIKALTIILASSSVTQQILASVIPFVIFMTFHEQPHFPAHPLPTCSAPFSAGSVSRERLVSLWSPSTVTCCYGSSAWLVKTQAQETSLSPPRCPGTSPSCVPLVLCTGCSLHLEHSYPSFFNWQTLIHPSKPTSPRKNFLIPLGNNSHQCLSNEPTSSQALL